MICDELKFLLNKNKMSHPELAEKADLPHETVRNLYYGKVVDPKVSTMLAISKVLGVTINRLMGEHVYTIDEERLIMNYRRCGHHGRSMIALIANYEAELSRDERNAENKFTIPCIVPIEPIHDGVEYSASKMIDITTDNSEAYIAIQVTSNEFVPIFCKDDRVLFADRFPTNGETAVFFIDGIMYCRQYQEHDDGYLLKALSRHGKDFHMKRLENVKYLGTCVGVIRS